MAAEERKDRIYAFGYSPAAVGMMESRSAEQHAGFFASKLTPGMGVLDIGCGPGSITVGLAAVVSPGEVTGIDIEPSQIALGQSRAESLGLKNCRFQTGSVYDLPIADHSVDAVFGHTILMQFRDLAPVLAEIRRVLKPGGLIGFRETDFGANLYHSEDSAVRKVLSTLRQTILHNDGNPDVGHALPSIVSGAGFEVVSASATYAGAATPEAKLGMYGAIERLWEQADFVAQAESLGMISARERAEMAGRLQQEAAEPASFSGTTYVEIIARNPSA